MKNVVKMSIALMGIMLVATSCESESVAEQEANYHEISKEHLFEKIMPTGTVTPKKIKKPGGGTGK